MKTLIVSANDANQTLINYLKKVFKTLSLSHIYRLLRTKKIRINGKQITDFKFQLTENDGIDIYESNLAVNYQQERINKQPDITIVYEDENFLIVNKPHNLVVHQPYGLNLDIMVRYYLQEQNPKSPKEQTFTISHQYRLDKLTKGLIIYSKNKITQNSFYQAIQNGNIIKKYLAICKGQLTKSLTISGYISHDENEMKMNFTLEESEHSKSCATIFTPLFTNRNFTLIECQLITGRKHQIRATLQFLNLPIIGDNKYGSDVPCEQKIALYAYYLGFKNLEGHLSYLNDKEFMLKEIKSDLIN